MFTLNQKSGFTLIEMMVSVSIFVLVAFTITGTLISVSNASRKAQELKLVMDNLNFSIQSMVLRMREGTKYTCGDTSGNIPSQANGFDNCPDGRTAVAFLDPSQNVGGLTGYTAYYLAAASTPDRGKIIRTDTPSGAGLVITSEEVDIDSLKFYISGNPANAMESTTGQTPSILIVVKGIVKLRSGGQSNFVLQTTVTQHNPS